MQADYVVVGSGSSGGIVAARLSEAPDTSVILLEAGPENTSPILHIPAAARYAFNAPQYNWDYETEPEPNLDGRRLKQARGRVLGGSSSINGLVYLRGNALDYEGWANAGAQGWAYADVLPYFCRLEGWENPTNEYQGKDGPIGVSTAPKLNPISEAFLKACAEAGYRPTNDVNGYSQEGFGRFPMNARNGYRWSTAHGFLREARKRPNLSVLTKAEATRIVWDDKRAIAILYRQGGAERAVKIVREVILCSGPFNTPKLLMQSGVGPAEHLREHGISVLHDLPGVGANLQDHQISAIQMACPEPVSLFKHLGPLGQVRAIARWLVFHDGVLASNHFETGAFVRSEAGIKFPNLQFYCFPIAVEEGSKDFYKFHGFQVQVSPQRSRSKGRVKLKGPSVDDGLSIAFNYQSCLEDWVEFRSAFRLAREILGQPAMDSYRGRELSPGVDVQTDDEIDAFVRDHMQSSYHPSGTCKMGNGPDAVVDPECRVHGVDAVRVADSSIMPMIPSCNLNAPSMMIGEKASDHILGRRLPPSNLPYFVDPEWQTRQRPGTPLRKLA